MTKRWVQWREWRDVMMELRNMRYARLDGYPDMPWVVEGICALYDANLISRHQMRRLVRAMTLTF